MERKIYILEYFFLFPNRLFHIREIAKLKKINHATVRNYIKRLEQEGHIMPKLTTPFTSYKANTGSKKYLNLKMYYNLEKIRESGIVENLEKHFDYPTIVLFGSYSKAFDDEKSDVDLCIISEIKTLLELSSFKKIIKRDVSLHLFDKRKWIESKKKNPSLVNSICNGIVLSGQLEVL